MKDPGPFGGTPPLPLPASRLERVFARILRVHWPIVVLFALLLPPSAYFAMRVDQDNSLDRLMVQTDPDYIATREFQKVFGAGEFALLVAEADDPYSAAVVGRVDAIERALQQVPHVTATSAVSIFRRTRASFEATPEDAAAFRKFVGGTDLLRKQAWSATAISPSDWCWT